jgi:hypothetical protein
MSENATRVLTHRRKKQLRKDPAAFERLIAGWHPVTYQLEGPKMNLRVGYFDHTIIPNPRVWLEARLGRLKVFTDGPKFGEALIGL